MQDKLQCPQDSSVKQADRCQRRSLRQNTTKGDTAEASWCFGSLGHIQRGQSMVGLSQFCNLFLVLFSPFLSLLPLLMVLHVAALHFSIIIGPTNDFQSLGKNKSSGELAASHSFVFVLWLFCRGHTCWTWFFPLATLWCSERFSSIRAGWTVLFFSVPFFCSPKSNKFPPKCDRIKDEENAM